MIWCFLFSLLVAAPRGVFSLLGATLSLRAASHHNLLQGRFGRITQRIHRLQQSELSDADELRVAQLKEDLREKALELERLELELRRFVEPLQTGTWVRARASASGGFVAKSDPQDDGDTVPPSAVKLASRNFVREWREVRSKKEKESQPDSEFCRKVALLTLSNDAIWAKEKNRPSIQSPWVLKVPYYLLCFILDFAFDGRPINRLYFLETVARMPYFSYITCLHTYETIGWWRRSTAQKRIHFAEELNEFNHLQIMEFLGGDQEWVVRFLAQHASIVYYFVLIVLWVLSPTLAYGFSELIEMHAVDTYTTFAEENQAILESMEVPAFAKEYWMGADMYLYDEFQSQRPKGSRRPVLRNMFDVFMTIAGDEAEHVATMRACQDPATKVSSPNTEAAILTLAALALTLAVYPINIDSLDPFREDIASGLEDVVDAAATATGGVDWGSNVGEEGEAVEAAAALGAVPVLKQLSQWVEALRKVIF